MPKEKEETKVEEVKKPEPKIAKIVEVTTQTAPAIQLENGDIVDALTLQVLIYNKLLKIEKSVA